MIRPSIYSGSLMWKRELFSQKQAKVLKARVIQMDYPGDFPDAFGRCKWRKITIPEFYLEVTYQGAVNSRGDHTNKLKRGSFDACERTTSDCLSVINLPREDAKAIREFTDKDEFLKKQLEKIESEIIKNAESVQKFVSSRSWFKEQKLDQVGPFKH